MTLRFRDPAPDEGRARLVLAALIKAQQPPECPLSRHRTSDEAERPPIYIRSLGPDELPDHPQEALPSVIDDSVTGQGEPAQAPQRFDPATTPRGLQL